MKFPLVQLNGPYDFAHSIGFWQRSTLELCEQWADGVYRRIVMLDGQPRLLTARSVGELEQPVVSIDIDGVAATPAELAALEPQIRWLLGDATDLRGFYAAVAGDEVLHSVTQQLYGIRPPRSPLWETLCWVIIGQQISLPFARTLKTRLVTRYGDGFVVAGRTLFLFPPPERLAVAALDDLLAMQFSRNKASFILGLAQEIVDGTLDLAAIAALPTEQAIAQLIRYRGIGRWTAEFILLRALHRADALPANDAGVRQSITALYGQKLPEAELRLFAERWQGWRGLAGLYLLGWLKLQAEQSTRGSAEHE